MIMSGLNRYIPVPGLNRYIPALLNLVFVHTTTSLNFKANIVEAPSSYGHQQQFANAAPGLWQLTSKRRPAPFVGADSLRFLGERCFKLDKDQYEWKLCPFHNATQTETTSRWNPYRGILGIWSGWKIDAVNNVFLTMTMTDGDDCGSRGPRQVDVKPECGSEESLSSVAEPNTCHYAMTLRSPIFCDSQSLLVYPTLTADHRAEWDEAFTDWKSEILTEKGYARALKDILVAAGISDSRRLTTTSAFPVGGGVGGGGGAAAAAAAANFAEAAAGCNANEYKELLEKYERLGRQHAETILELGRCQRDLRQLTEAGVKDVIEI